MWWGKKKKNKITKQVDRFVMGAIIGGAIGSVLGMTLAPKKGKETREFLKEKAKEFKEKHGDQIKNIQAEVVREGKNLFGAFKKKIDQIQEEKEEEDRKKIPHED